jgi:hypothetical protein
METAFNLAWLLLAVALVPLWVSHAPHKGAGWRVQAVALALTILILFPVISVTDDLIALQYPAEVEIYVRRGHTAVSHHSYFPAVAVPSPVFMVGLNFGDQRPAALSDLSALTVKNPALSSIQSRPPPVARSIVFIV